MRRKHNIWWSPVTPHAISRAPVDNSADPLVTGAGDDLASFQVGENIHLPTHAHPYPWWSIFGIFVLIFGATGCGSACPTVSQERAEFFAQSLPRPALHGSLDVPFELMNGLFTEQIRGMKPVPVTIPGLGKYQRKLGAVSIAPRSIRIIPGKPGQVHFDLDFTVLHRKKALFTMETTAAVTPQVDGGRLLIPLGPEALRKVKPTLSPKAADQLAGAIYGALPKAMRMVVPRRALKGIANKALGQLVDGGYGLLRDSVVAEMAPRTQIALDLPGLPVEGVQIRSRQGWLAVGMKTLLPVKGVLPRTKMAPANDRMRLRLMGGAVAAMGNKAIESGELPQRLNAKGKPSKTGEYRPGLSWESGERPAKIWLWREQGTCMRARIGATPHLSAGQNKSKQQEVRVKVDDGTIEDVEGSMLLSAGAWIQGLWSDAIQVSKSVAAQTGFEVGERKVEVAVQRAQVLGDVVELDLSAVHR